MKPVLHLQEERERRARRRRLEEEPRSRSWGRNQLNRIPWHPAVHPIRNPICCLRICFYRASAILSAIFSYSYFYLLTRNVWIHRDIAAESKLPGRTAVLSDSWWFCWDCYKGNILISETKIRDSEYTLGIEWNYVRGLDDKSGTCSIWELPKPG